MDERERRDIMLRAIHRYGEAAQIDMAVEEMAELTKALCKVKRATPGATTTAAIANVIEEIADVQLRRLLGRLNSYAESNLHEWLNRVHDPQKVWSRTAATGTQPREGGAPDE
nr:MAG: MazG-like family protein [Bacteriophage sp.]